MNLLITCVILGLVVGRQSYGELKEASLAKQARENRTFDQKMSDWEADQKSRTIKAKENDLMKKTIAALDKEKTSS